MDLEKSAHTRQVELRTSRPKIATWHYDDMKHRCHGFGLYTDHKENQHIVAAHGNTWRVLEKIKYSDGSTRWIEGREISKSKHERVTRLSEESARTMLGKSIEE